MKVEDTKLSTNKQHTLSLAGSDGDRITGRIITLSVTGMIGPVNNQIIWWLLLRRIFLWGDRANAADVRRPMEESLLPADSGVDLHAKATVRSFFW